MFAKLKKLITISRSLFIYNDPERNRFAPLRGFRKRVRLGESRRRPAMHRLSPDSSGHRAGFTFPPLRNAPTPSFPRPGKSI